MSGRSERRETVDEPTAEALSVSYWCRIEPLEGTDFHVIESRRDVEYLAPGATWPFGRTATEALV